MSDATIIGMTPEITRELKCRESERDYEQFQKLLKSKSL